jgi:ADP-heptose:LPS heptosyltransferase
MHCWSLQVGAAATILAMDLVITVDTAVAHLAGSLGKPVWLLPAYASDTPWYPTIRIFRQQGPGD